MDSLGRSDGCMSGVDVAANCRLSIDCVLILLRCAATNSITFQH